MRLVVVAAAVAVIATASYIASAAALGLSTTKVGAGDASIARCDTNGFTVGYTLSGSNVNAVTIAAIADPGCEGATVSVTLTNSSGTSIGAGSGTVPTDGGTVDNSMTITVSPTPAETNLVSIHLSLVGP